MSAVSAPGSVKGVQRFTVAASGSPTIADVTISAVSSLSKAVEALTGARLADGVTPSATTEVFGSLLVTCILTSVTNVRFQQAVQPAKAMTFSGTVTEYC